MSKRKKIPLKKRILWLLCAVLVIALLYMAAAALARYVESAVATLPQTGEETAPIAVGSVDEQSLHIPLCPHGGGHERRDYTGYSICYREPYEQAEWAAEHLTRDKLVKEASRTDNFRADKAISTDSATPADYTSSGYDRGHLVPAADMAWSEEAMSESFYMSNMSPQEPGFNRGVWNRLEAQVRDWADAFGSVYAVSGPLLEKETYPVIGKNAVAVPEFYYKVLLAHTDGDTWAAIGFILPNEKSSESLAAFAVPVNEVEARTNIDFFYLLSDDAEEALESTPDLAFWGIAE